MFSLYILGKIISFYKKQLIVTALLYIIQRSDLFGISVGNLLIKMFSTHSLICVETIK